LEPAADLIDPPSWLAEFTRREKKKENGESEDRKLHDNQHSRRWPAACSQGAESC
jgi:hypothetical protein